MAAEEVLIKLFESHWFGHESSTKSLSPYSPQLQEQNPFLETQEDALKVNAQDLTNPHLPTLHVRSISDQTLFFSKTSSDHLSFSPNSVLFSASSTPKLQPILSGKVMKDHEHVTKVDPIITRGSSRKSTRRRKKLSKSMSELEFDEVKGFMDLGFVFSEEDKASSLVSIIPGLQRFIGSREDHDDDDVKVLEESHVVVSRPYLSEAWDGLGQRSRRDHKAKMINYWRVPSNLGSEVDMKDNLKLWAHSVASTVR